MYHGTHITKEKKSIWYNLYSIFVKTFFFSLLGRNSEMLSVRSFFLSVLSYMCCQYFQSPSIHPLLLLFYHSSISKAILFCSVLACPIPSPPSPNACLLFVSCTSSLRSIRGVYPFLSMECHLKSFFYYRTQTGIL